MRCAACQELLELREVPPVRAREGPLAVEITGLRCRRCGADDHPPEPPYPHFAADLVSAATRGGALPTVERGGLLRKRDRCFRCGGDPGADAGIEGELRARLRLEGAAPLTLEVSGPLVECGACGCRQLEAGPERRAQLEEALIRALTEAGLSVR